MKETWNWYLNKQFVLFWWSFVRTNQAKVKQKANPEFLTKHSTTTNQNGRNNCPLILNRPSCDNAKVWNKINNICSSRELLGLLKLKRHKNMNIVTSHLYFGYTSKGGRSKIQGYQWRQQKKIREINNMWVQGWSTYAALTLRVDGMFMTQNWSAKLQKIDLIIASRLAPHQNEKNVHQQIKLIMPKTDRLVWYMDKQYKERKVKSL